MKWSCGLTVTLLLSDALVVVQLEPVYMCDITSHVCRVRCFVPRVGRLLKDDIMVSLRKATWTSVVAVS